MSIIPIEVAMQHVYADEADQPQVERKLASAIESAEQYMGRRIYANADELAKAQASATASLGNLKPLDDTLPVLALQTLADARRSEQYALVMQMRGVVMNSSIEIGILLILGDLYANRENTTDKPANELPMGALHHLQPFRYMGV